MRRSFFIRYKFYHLLIWMIVALVWYYLRYQDYSTTRKAIDVSLIKTIDLALMVYVANYLLIPFFLYKKRYAWFVCSFIAMIVTSSIYKMYLLGKITNNPALMHLSGDIKTRIYDNVIPHFFLVIAGVSIKLLFDYTQVQKRLTEVAKEKAEAELNFLKSQINPHFVFNSLNAIYFLIDRNNVRAREALHKFSDMLRYQLYEVKDEKIPIEKEIAYLKDYIGLQQLRNDHCSVELQLQDDMKSFSIEPLLLIPLVENSFKHLSHFNNGKKNEIRIGLTRQNGEMNFAVRNTTEGGGNELKKQGGIGLKNVRRRLELLYPQKHQFRISENGGWFDVHLKIKMDL
ncbi:MAG: sensor histidine kinase [Flavisolibacter sp.]